MGADLDVLLVEDNPGDARLIEEMLADADELLQRVDVNGTPIGGSRLRHEQRLAAGLDRLDGGGVDVVLLDLGLPDSTGLETLDAVRDATEFVPIVVLTGLRDEQVGIEAIQRGAQDYLVKADVTSDLLVRAVHHAIERNRQERERVRRLDQLAALNRLNEISQDVTHAVITTSTREDLERAVCERLVADEGYPFAWIGEVNRSTSEITPRVGAGAAETYLDDVTVTVDDDAGEGPAGRAVRTREVQVVRDTATDPAFGPWRDLAAEHGFRSGVVVPIVHDRLLYGVLCLYATAPDAFPEPAVDILARLGDVIGHAITAIERRDALQSDSVLELEFAAAGVCEDLVALATDAETTVAVENVVHSDETVVAYGHVAGIEGPDFEAAATAADGVEDCRVLDAADDALEFEVVASLGSDLIEAVATRGGVVTSASLGDGEFRFVVRFPRGPDKRGLVELVETHCPGAVPRAQRTVERQRDRASTLPAVLESALTEKQRTALEVAYFAGYFEWPRTSTSEEISDRLDVTPATFTHHLRAAERRFFDDVFAATADADAASDWTALDTDATDG